MIGPMAPPMAGAAARMPGLPGSASPAIPTMQAAGAPPTPQLSSPIAHNLAMFGALGNTAPTAPMFQFHGQYQGPGPVQSGVGNSFSQAPLAQNLSNPFMPLPPQAPSSIPGLGAPATPVAPIMPSPLSVAPNGTLQNYVNVPNANGGYTQVPNNLPAIAALGGLPGVQGGPSGTPYVPPSGYYEIPGANGTAPTWVQNLPQQSNYGGGGQ